MSGKRVCLIGAGPSGLSFLYHIEKLRQEGKVVPEIVCFEKQNNWGGLWNYNWRTGLDENGEYVHNSMYRYLWSNGPRECIEFPDYSFEEHFGKSIPSFPPREVLFDYLQGRFNKMNVRRYITLETVVREVKYHPGTDDFTVVVKDLAKDVLLPEQRFDYIVNASGHFSVPHVPVFDGFDKFPGRILHSHDYRDACEFKGQNILIIGASYSAEDLALQSIKYGAKSVITSYRNEPMGFKWPPQITERPLLIKVEGNTATFKDGSTAEVDSIVLCTGFKHHYPYMEANLTLTGQNVLYLENTYMSTLWLKGGNNKVLYIGATDQYYTFTLFDVQAAWAAKYIIGEVKVPSRNEMLSHTEKWLERRRANKSEHDEIDFQTDHMREMGKDCNYGYDLDTADMFHTWEHHKDENILTYRDKSFTSKFTGNKSPIHHSTFMEALDDSMKCYLSIKE
ncbi:trimethylamine monooxygenase-like [Tubulanus polymorphus]|uniref:trimethylamine monooxygenase-like n=1 Tax=Tubulanus polymorphus TaxID=672921 RepID=UPI003DA546E8